MRVLCIALLFLPFAGKAQINRSATELAHENIREYISDKVFKDRLYKAGSYSKLQHYKKPHPDIVWIIDHQFDILEPSGVQGTDTTRQAQHYRFTFYLDKKLSVVSAMSVR